jgi:hypothetical protein
MKTFTLPKIIAGGLFISALALTGCLTNTSDSGAPAITTQPPSTVTAAYGDTVTISIVATGDAPLTYTWVVDGDTIGDETTATLKGVPPATANGAKIVCIVRNSKGSVTTNAATLTITGLTTYPSATTLTVGAQASSNLGSAIDLDSGKVWLSGVANANLPKIDLVFLYYSGNFHLDGAAAARDSGIAHSINLTNGYGATVKDIKMVAVTSKPGSQQAAKEIYDEESEPQRSSIITGAGEKFIVKTTENKYVYLETVSKTNGTSCAGTGDPATSCATESLSVSLSTL